MKRPIRSIHKEIVTARGVPWAKAATGGKEKRTNGRARESITETNPPLFAPHSFPIRHTRLYDFHFHPIFVKRASERESKNKKRNTPYASRNPGRKHGRSVVKNFDQSCRRASFEKTDSSGALKNPNLHGWQLTRSSVIKELVATRALAQKTRVFFSLRLPPPPRVHESFALVKVFIPAARRQKRDSH